MIQQFTTMLEICRVPTKYRHVTENVAPQSLRVAYLDVENISVTKLLVYSLIHLLSFSKSPETSASKTGSAIKLRKIFRSLEVERSKDHRGVGNTE